MNSPARGGCSPPPLESSPAPNTTSPGESSYAASLERAESSAAARQAVRDELAGAVVGLDACLLLEEVEAAAKAEGEARLVRGYEASVTALHEAILAYDFAAGAGRVRDASAALAGVGGVTATGTTSPSPLIPDALQRRRAELVAEAADRRARLGERCRGLFREGLSVVVADGDGGGGTPSPSLRLRPTALADALACLFDLGSLDEDAQTLAHTVAEGFLAPLARCRWRLGRRVDAEEEGFDDDEGGVTPTAAVILLPALPPTPSASQSLDPRETIGALAVVFDVLGECISPSAVLPEPACAAARLSLGRALWCGVGGDGSGVASSLAESLRGRFPVAYSGLPAWVTSYGAPAVALEEGLVEAGWLPAADPVTLPPLPLPLATFVASAPLHWAEARRATILADAARACTRAYGAETEWVGGAGGCAAPAAPSPSAPHPSSSTPFSPAFSASLRDLLDPPSAAAAEPVDFVSLALLLPRMQASATAVAVARVMEAGLGAAASVADDDPVGRRVADALARASADAASLFCASVSSRFAGALIDVPRLPALLHNDCVLLASVLARACVSAAAPGEAAAACAAVIPTLSTYAQRALVGVVQRQRAALVGLVDSLPPLAEVGDGGEGDASASALRAGTAALTLAASRLGSSWGDILPPFLFARLVGTLLDTVLHGLCERVLALAGTREGIGAEPSTVLARLLADTAAGLPQAACAGSGPPGTSAVDVSTVAPFVRSRPRALALSRLLDSPLADLCAWVRGGEAAREGALEGAEIAKMIRALFNPTPERDKLLRELA
jgi:hypothetical protein